MQHYIRRSATSESRVKMGRSELYAYTMAAYLPTRAAHARTAKR